MKRKRLLMLLCLIFIATASYSGYQILTILHEYREGDDTYGQMQQFIDMSATVPVAKPAEPKPEQEATEAAQTQEAGPEVMETVPAPTEAPVIYPAVDFDALEAINEDVVAWVYVEGTNINYPVVQGDDNRHYVSYMIDGTYNGAGSIFMDYRNEADLTDRHTILYGHNMKNGSMFANITDYRDQEYYDAHPTGMVMTPEQNYQFEIVAGYVASLADAAWQLEFFDDEDALDWVQDAMGRSGFVSSYTPQPGDKFITLSTCTYEFNEARFVLVGVLK